MWGSARSIRLRELYDSAFGIARFRQTMMKQRFFGNGFLVLLGLLVCTDIVFIGLHLVHTYTPLLPNHVYSIEQDKGHAEFFQYTKQFWIILLLTLTFIKEASLTNFSWLMVFCYVLLDDALSIHENLGLLTSGLWTFAANLGLRPRDWGELLVTGAVGVILLTPVTIAFLRASSRERRHTLVLGGLLILLAFSASSSIWCISGSAASNGDWSRTAGK